MYPLSDNHKCTSNLCVSRFVVVFTLTEDGIRGNRPAIERVLPKWYGSSNHNINDSPTDNQELERVAKEENKKRNLPQEV